MCVCVCVCVCIVRVFRGVFICRKDVDYKDGYSGYVQKCHPRTTCQQYALKVILHPSIIACIVAILSAQAIFSPKQNQPTRVVWRVLALPRRRTSTSGRRQPRHPWTSTLWSEYLTVRSTACQHECWARPFSHICPFI